LKYPRGDQLEKLEYAIAIDDEIYGAKLRWWHC
jgi:hypothetical protein